MLVLAERFTLQKLDPKDFEAPLFAGLFDVRDRTMLPTVTVRWGQPVIFFPVSEHAQTCGFWVYQDAGARGEPIYGCTFRAGVIQAWRGDAIRAHGIPWRSSRP